MGARPELVDLLDRLDDLDPILDPAPHKIPTAGGLPITADELCLLGHSTIGDVIEAAKQVTERHAWRVVAMGNAIEASKAAREVLAPYWHDDTALKDALEAAPPAVRDQTLALFAEHDRWCAGIGGTWNMTEADLEEGWLRGEYRRVELDDNGHCIVWRRITIIDPDVAKRRAELVAEYRDHKVRYDALVEEAAEKPSAVEQIIERLSEEDRRAIIAVALGRQALDLIDEQYGIPVDDAGMPVGGA